MNMSKYEAAELTLIGTAEENILGMIGMGSDADLTGFGEPLLFMEDADIE
jgi:hypothetical protein